MKKTKFNILSLALALVMLIASLASVCTFAKLNVSANADDDEPKKLYYYSDWDPLIDAGTMQDYFPEYEVTYKTVKYLTIGDLTAITMSGYFDFLSNGEYDVIIFQITEIRPPVKVLSYIFSGIDLDKTKIILFSNYDEYELSHTDLSTLLYKNYTIKSSFYEYVERSVKNMYDKGFNLENLSILVDERYIDFSVLKNKDYWYDNKEWLEQDGWNYSEEEFYNQNQYIFRLCYYSEYLRALLQQLCAYFLHNGTAIYDYTSIVNQLNRAHVKLLINIDNLRYLNLFEGFEAEFDDQDEGRYIFDISENLDLDIWGADAAAMGQTRLKWYFYNQLSDIQFQFEVYDIEFPVYIYEVDPIDYDENGLKIITDTDLYNMYGGSEQEELLDYLDGVI